jgi:hypothetical protein
MMTTGTINLHANGDTITREALRDALARALRSLDTTPVEPDITDMGDYHRVFCGDETFHIFGGYGVDYADTCAECGLDWDEHDDDECDCSPE